MKYLKNIFVCFIISVFLGLFIVKYFNKENNILASDECYEVTEYFKDLDNKDVNIIKTNISDVVLKEEQQELQKLEVILNNGMSTKDIFKINNGLMIGDSFIEGMDCYNMVYKSNTIWKRGQRADNLGTILNEVYSINPKILVIGVGTNDLKLWKEDIQKYIYYYKHNISEIKRILPNTKIAVLGILKPSDNRIKINPYYKLYKDYNTELEKLCLEEDIIFIDSNYLFNEADNLYQRDGIHVKRSFYHLWIKDIIYKLGL